MILLIDYINDKHGGNKSEFARSIGVVPQQIEQYLNAKKPVYVVDGYLVSVLRQAK